MRVERIIAGLGLLMLGGCVTGVPTTCMGTGCPATTALPDMTAMTAHPDMAVASPPDIATPDLATRHVWTTLAFGAMSSYPTNGVNPLSLVVLDLNGDGKLDAVTTNHGPAGGGTTLAVYLGNGNGTLQAATNPTVSAGPQDLHSTDFNGDGHPDIYVPAYQGLDILLGNGAGSFAPVKVQSAGTQPYIDGDVGDFNGDGHPDVIYGSDGGGMFGIALGNGDGTLKAPKEYATGFGSTGSIQVSAGDFNNDQKLDLIAVAGSYPNLHILLGNGDGTFQAPVTVTAMGVFSPAVVRDINQDGNVDLILSDGNAATISVLLGDGKGNFQNPIQTISAAFVVVTDVVDIDGDGLLDLISANDTPTNSVGIFLGKGGGSFAPMKTVIAGNRPQSALARDMNGDGKLDLVVVNYGDNTVGVLLGDPQ